MKIRNGFVSNSSSSSFLVISFNKIYDFFKFKDFKGHDIFMKDIENDTDEESKGFIYSFLIDYYYDEYSKFMKKDMPGGINIDNIDYIRYLFDISGADDKDYWNIISKVNKNGMEFWVKNHDNFGTNKNQDEIRDYQNSYYEDEESKRKIEETANKIFDGMKAKGINVNFVRYDDDTDDGCYMETGFMPFLMANPEKNYCIISINEH